MPIKGHISVGGYYGGKAELMKFIQRQFDTPHKIFCDLFMGGGSVLLNKPKIKYEIGNDYAGDVTIFWRVLRDKPTEFLRAVTRTPAGSAAIKELKNLPDPEDDIERARRFYMTTQQNFAQQPNSRSPTLIMSWQWTNRRQKQRIVKVVKRLRDVILENRDATKLIDRVIGLATKRVAGDAGNSNILFYADPPYLDITRRTPCDDYIVDSSDAKFHEKFLKKCIDGGERGAKFVISGYDSELYNDILKGWIVEKKDKGIAVASTNRGKDNKCRRKEEVIWRNFQLEREKTKSLKKSGLF